MSGIINSTGARSGVIGTTVGTPTTTTVAGTCYFVAANTYATWLSISAGAICDFDAEVTDPDGVYNPSTKLFTAPAAGVYIFGYSIYTAENRTLNQFDFRINGLQLAYSYHDTAIGSYIVGDDDQVGTFCAAFTLATSDTVGVYARATADFYEGHSWWWGCRLS